MFISVLLCLSLTFLAPLCYTLSAEEARYECGPHGKFEYCIDGIPGCVIGCHCHPGYYFDTDTKICELNTKLTKDFRRRYMAEPTRVYPLNTPTTTENIPTPTTSNVLDEKVDEIAKDTDDLGDWLYNQFFKTIESQVIQNQSLTRRTGGDIFEPGGEAKRGGSGHRRTQSNGDNNADKSKRNRRKSSRGKGKKKKSKVHGLRRKLLRITEDDSLFDSDSSTESESSDSDSSSSSSDTSVEVDTSKEKKETENRDHDHKKVLIYNRRPRPPLPSFVFLPSMDTPYYPPIGLPPPPPVLPMYPMIPIPPMPPFIPFREPDNNNSTTTEPTTKSSSTETSTDKSKANETAETSNTEPTSPETPVNILRTGARIRKGHKSRKTPPKTGSSEMFLMRAQDSEANDPITSKRAKRIKLMQKLRERLMLKQKLIESPVGEADVPNEEMPLYDDITSLQDLLPLQQFINEPKHRFQKKNEPQVNDVNFKYLTELIHRVNFSNPKKPPLPAHITEGLKQLENLQKTRRNYSPQAPVIQYNDQTPINRNSYAKDPDDEYFTKLGRQIAALIRDNEYKVEKNRIMEQKDQNNLIESIINSNSHTSPSYWERSVRSPLTTLKNYIGRLNNNKQSNEKHLFNLEDEVNTFVRISKTPPMSLQDLENVLSIMQKSQTDMKKTKHAAEHSNGSFNVNLLPFKLEPYRRKSYHPPDYVEYTPRTTKFSKIDHIKSNGSRYMDSDSIDSPMAHDWLFNTHNIEPKRNYNEPQPNKDPSVHMRNITSIDQYNTNVSHYMNPASMDSPIAHEWLLNTKKVEPKNKLNNPQSNQDSSMNMVTNETTEQVNTNGETKSTITPYFRNTIVKTIPKKPEKYLKFLKSAPVATHSNVLKSELPVKYSEIPTKYPSAPTVLNYKSLNYFSKGGNNHHYMFQASYPVQVPTYKKSAPKYIESNHPSYFHHELHHFDYFD